MDVQAATQAAQRFEASTLGALLAPMFETVPTGPFDGGAAEQTWRPMMVTEMAKQVAAHGGIGLAAPVLRQMLQLQEQTP